MCVLISFLFVFLAVHMTCGINIDVQPRKFSGDNGKDVRIYCTLDEAEASIKEIMMLKVSRKGERAIAIVHANGNITYHSGNNDEFLATGNIGVQGEKTSMTLVIKTPEPEDSGTYTCNIIYLNTIGVLIEHKASAYLKVDDPEVKDLRSTVKDLVQKTSKGEKDIKELKMLQQVYKTTLTNALNRVDKQTAKIKELTEKNKQLNDEVVKLKTNEVLFQKQVTQLVNSSGGLSVGSRTSGNALPVIAFSATNQNLYIRAQVGRVPIFPDVILNEGSGYDPKTGIFTAPTSGIYVFHLVVKLNCNDCYAQLGLLANNGLLIKLKTGSKYDAHQNTVSAVTKLKKGDTVKPYTDSASSNALFTTNRLSIFSGYVINTI